MDNSQAVIARQIEHKTVLVQDYMQDLTKKLRNKFFGEAWFSAQSIARLTQEIDMLEHLLADIKAS